MAKFCGICGSSDIRHRPTQDIYDCRRCQSSVTGLGESMKYHDARDAVAPDYGVVAAGLDRLRGEVERQGTEVRRHLGLIATHSDEISKLRKEVAAQWAAASDRITGIANQINAPVLAENPNFGKELVDRFRLAQDTIVRRGIHSAEFCVYGNDGYQYGVRVSR